MHIMYKESVFRHSPEFYLRGFFEKQKPLAPHQQMFVEIVFILGGSALHYTEPEGYQRISRGEVFIIPDGGIHGYSECQDLEIFNLLFIADKLPLPLLELYAHPSYKRLFGHKGHWYQTQEINHIPYPHFVFNEEELNSYEPLLREFAGLQQSDAPGSNCGKLGLLMTILSKLCDALPRKKTVENSPTLAITEVLNHLHKNFRQKITIQELSKLVSLAPNTLLRHFKLATGHSPIDYLLQLRLMTAAQLLTDTVMNLDEVTAQSGFNSKIYFHAKFKEKFGSTPLEYRSKTHSKK